jgi:hypothetical protein
MPRRSRRMKGGLFGFGESNGTVSSFWDKITGKKPAPSYAPMLNEPIAPAAPQPGMGYGGRRHKKYHMKGGYTYNAPGGLATYAAPISGVKNAQPHNWVGGPEYKGGRTRKYRRGGKHRHSKSCKHRKH